MKTELFLNKLSLLSDKDKNLVLEFIEFLSFKERKNKKSFKKNKLNFDKEPFVGLWKERDNLSDSVAWVREVRHTDWGD